MRKHLSWIACTLFMFAVFTNGPVLADGKIGIVLMHGKDGTANAGSIVGKLASKLSSDFIVVTPEMPWSRDNGIDKTLEQSFDVIDSAVAGLRADGADRVVVGGHSMGAATALAYATQRTGLAGVMMIAPGHRPDAWGNKNADAVARAKSLVSAGKADETVDVYDVNQGDGFSRTLRADIALSWFDPDGLIVMQNAAPQLSADMPVLFIVGEKDRFHPKGKRLVFEKLPSNAKSAYVVVEGGHKATPMKGRAEIVSWLNGL